MGVAGQYGAAMVATIRRDALIFISYRFRIVSQIIGMLFTLTIFFYIGKLVRPDAVGPRGSVFRLRGRGHRRDVGAHVGAHERPDRSDGVDGRDL